MFDMLSQKDEYLLTDFSTNSSISEKVLNRYNGFVNCLGEHNWSCDIVQCVDTLKKDYVQWYIVTTRSQIKLRLECT